MFHFPAFIKENAIILIQNPYGNYALQIALDHWNINDCISIINQFLGNSVILSVQKFSSNVIEKCFEKYPKFLISFLSEIYENDYSGLKILIQNTYGNYVLNKALFISKNELRSNLINSIKLVLPQISDRKITKKWNNILSNYLY